jgi:hypothetical protein
MQAIPHEAPAFHSTRSAILASPCVTCVIVPLRPWVNGLSERAILHGEVSPLSRIGFSSSGSPTEGFGMVSESSTCPEPSTAPMPARMFGVADAMLLVAGLSLALAGGLRLIVELGNQWYYLCRTIADYNSPFYAKRPGFWKTWVAIYWSQTLFYGVRVFENFILGITPAFLLVRLRRPRPPVRALLRHPGTVAGLAILFGQFWVTGWLHRLFFGRLYDAVVTPIAVGGTVASAWTILALSRRWEPEPGWVDRIGRTLGAAAIVIGALAFTLYGI